MLTVDLTDSVQRTLLSATSSRLTTANRASTRAWKSRFDVLNAYWECVRLAAEHSPLPACAAQPSLPRTIESHPEAHPRP
jgi:hypothetical protein